MSMDRKTANALDKYLTQEPEDECAHDEHDHGYCLDCGKDVSGRLIASAEYASEGER